MSGIRLLEPAGAIREKCSMTILIVDIFWEHMISRQHTASGNLSLLQLVMCDLVVNLQFRYAAWNLGFLSTFSFCSFAPSERINKCQLVSSTVIFGLRGSSGCLLLSEHFTPGRSLAR